MSIIVINPLSQCLICLEAGARTTQFPCRCSGFFHKPCLDKWYTQSGSCPICRVKNTAMQNMIYDKIKCIFQYLVAAISVSIALGIPIGVLYLLITNK